MSLYVFEQAQASLIFAIPQTALAAGSHCPGHWQAWRKGENMSSNPKITPLPEIASQNPPGIAEPELKDFTRCFATFADSIPFSSGGGRVVFLSLAAEGLLCSSLSSRGVDSLL